MFRLLPILLLSQCALGAWADAGQFRVKPLKPGPINGLSAKEVNRFHASVEALSAYLAGLPALNAPPAPLCVELSREVWGYPLLPMGQALISYNYLVPLSGQSCAVAQVVNSNIVFALNHASFIDKNTRVAEDAQGIIVRPQAYQRLGDGVYRITLNKRLYWVLTRGEEPLVPVSLERYLKIESGRQEERMAELERQDASLRDWWQDLRERYGPELQGAPPALRSSAENNLKTRQALQSEARQKLLAELQAARARLADLTPAQRASAACIEPLRGGLQSRVVPGPCQAPQQALLALNPALAPAPGDRAALRYLVIEAMDMRHSTEVLQHYEHRNAVMRDLDLPALAKAWQAAGR